MLANKGYELRVAGYAVDGPNIETRNAHPATRTRNKDS